MRKLNRNQAIAVFIGIALVAFLLYGNFFVGLFNFSSNQTVNTVNNAPQGLKIEDQVVGTGTAAAPGDTLTVHYVGTLPDGKVFDSSLDRNEPFSFTLGMGQVISGWDQGLVGMKVGGKRRLTIPPELAYGSRSVGPIPANSTLVFDVQLLSVTKGNAQ